MTRGYHHWRQALAGSTALIAVSLAASLALADGGSGGSAPGVPATGGGGYGQPGDDATTTNAGGGGGGAGGNGGSGWNNPGSGGNAGSGPGLDGGNGVTGPADAGGGGGGGGGANGATNTLPSTAVTGGRGGDGGHGGTGSGGGGGGGGEGGYGVHNSGSGGISQTVTGGAGGTGGNGTTLHGGGQGGVGGVGLLAATASIDIYSAVTGGAGGLGGDGSTGGPLGFTAVGGGGGAGGTGAALTNTTIRINGTITGGNGGLGGMGLTNTGTAVARNGAGAGGIGIEGSNINIITNGTISGGFRGDGIGDESSRNLAIRFTGGTNRLEIWAASVINGAVDARTGTNTLALGGNANSTIDVSKFTGATPQYMGFKAFETTGAGIWTLTGTTTDVTPWTVRGRLSIAEDGSLGDISSPLALTGGTLITTATITTARSIVTASGSGGAIQTDADLTLTGTISGTGSFWKRGTATLTVTGTSTYDGSLYIIGGTMAVSGGRLTITGGAGTEVSTGATLIVSGPTSVFETSRILLGLNGSGTLRITDGGRVTAQGPLDLWATASTVSVSGAGSTLVFNGLRPTSSGQSTTTVSAGGRVTSSGDVVIGRGASDTITVTGAGSVWEHVTASGLIIGWNSSAALTVADGGLFSVINGTGTIVVAQNGFPGTSSTLNIGAAAGAPPVAPGTVQAAAVQFGPVSFGPAAGAVTFNHTSTDYTFTPAIIGKGAINVLAGTSTLTADSSAFTGTTTVAGGTLRVDGKLGGTVTVNTGGTLGGTGTIAGPVTVGGGATLSAGASPGTLTVGTLTLNAGSTSRFELNSPGVVGGSTNDLVVVTGNLTLGGTLDAQVAAAGFYRLFNYGGSLTGAFDTTTATGTGGFTAARQQVETSIPNQVNLAVIGAGQTLQFWDGDGAGNAGNGTVDGGTGTWSSAAANWTGQPGQATINGTWGGSVGIFAGTAGSVTVSGTQAFDTLQFSTTGYTLTGGTLTLAPATGTTGTINVDANVAATIGSVIADGTGNGLNKIGAGTLILTGANTYSGGTTITTGTLQIGDGISNGRITGNVVNNGVLVFANSDNDSFAGVISGSGSVQYDGSGLVKLTGDNTYTGGTIIRRGALFIGDGGTSGAIVGNVVVAANASLAFARADTATFDGVVSGDGGIYQYSGTTVLTAAHTYTGDTGIVGGTLALGAGGSIAHSQDVRLGFGAALDITAAGDQTINNLSSTIGAAVQLGVNTLTVNVTSDRAFNGAITGTGGLVVTGTSALTLDGSNTYTGATTVAAGTLTLGASGSIAPSSAVTVATGATLATTGGGSHTVRHLAGVAGSTVTLDSALTVDTATATAFDGTISGNGSLIKSGAASWTFGGSASHTGGTTIDAGTLLVNGTIGGTVTVNAGGTLGGTGTITGPVTVGGTLSAGASPGTLTVGTLTLNRGSTSRFELNSPGVVGGASNDLVIVTGGLTLGGALDAQVAAGGYYRLFNYGSTLAGAFDTTAVTGTGGFTVARHQVETAPNQVNLAVVGTGQTLQFWDGGDSTGNGTVDGGAGTWDGPGTNWTGQPGQANTNGTWGGSVGVFAGTAGGTVTVVGTQAFDTLQFSTTGYRLTGGTLTLSPATGTTGTINVDAGITATIGSVIADGTGTGLNKIGPGTLILTGANTYSGGTTITAGTLQIGDGEARGSIIGNVVNNGVLAFANQFDDTFAGVISGSGSVRYDAVGRLTLTGANTYTGGTIIRRGAIFIGDGIGGTSGSIVGNVVVDGGYLAFARSDTYTFDGIISGTGGILQYGAETGGGTTVLTAAHTYTGSTRIFVGTLALGAGGSIAHSSFVSVDSEATFDITAAGNQTINNLIGPTGSTVRLGANTLTVAVSEDGTFSGAITGTGGLTVTGTNALTLNGSNTYTGATTVAAGTLTLGAAGSIAPSSAVTVAAGATLATTGGGSHTVRNLAGAAGATVSLDSALTVDTATATAFDGTITGSGSLIKSGASTWTFGGSASHTGGTAINAGILRANGTLGGSVTVNAGGTLGGTGTVGGIVANNGGTVSPGSSIGTLNVAGNVSFAPGSTYEVEIEPAGTSDRLNATGTATLSGGTVSVIKAAGSYTSGTRYTILTANAGVSGTFDGYTQNLPFINLALAYDPNNVFLDVTRNTASFCSLAGAPNQCAVANGAESLGAGNPLYDAIASLPDAASARRAFNALSGEVHASTRSALIEDSHYLRDAVVARTRLSGVATTAAPQVAALAQATDQSQRPQDGTAITAWFQGFGAIARTSGDGNATTTKRTTGGFFIGADTKIADTWTVGLATGYSRSTVDVDGRSSRATIDSYHLALYGGAQFGAIGVRLGASHTWHSIDSSRSITFPGVADAARADY
ncbi:autotransporter-associated beta strand repeat-containing protein, partial [Reyranella sp. CPCC 100927]|uniref:autotransporter-associated beta strand repeat-containing protein n=1 Tax=Reyranella sp. CPCC 100927 TaxID=2599616 RepID=UPI0015B75920